MYAVDTDTTPQDRQAERWDAEAEIALGRFIDRYITVNPPPEGSRVAPDIATWGVNLLTDGARRLDGGGA